MQNNSNLAFSVAYQFINYWGEVTEEVEIARFCSIERANEYIEHMHEAASVGKYVVKKLQKGV